MLNCLEHPSTVQGMGFAARVAREQSTGGTYLESAPGSSQHFNGTDIWEILAFLYLCGGLIA